MMAIDQLSVEAKVIKANFKVYKQQFYSADNLDRKENRVYRKYGICELQLAAATALSTTVPPT